MHTVLYLNVYHHYPLNKIINYESIQKWKSNSINEWTKKTCSTYAMEYYSTTEMNEILPFVTTCKGLKSIVLSKMSQRRHILYHFTHMWGLKEQNKWTKQNKPRLSGCQRERRLWVSKMCEKGQLYSDGWQELWWWSVCMYTDIKL